MAMRDFDDRVRAILNAIVASYIDIAEPVGSRTLSKSLDFGLSPATIRNVMADLTVLGFLNQPHASAGRVPTDKGYRYYVDSVVGGASLPANIRGRIDDVVRERSGSLEKTLEDTTKLLALLTHFTGVIAAPKVATTRLKLMEFIRVSENRIFVVLITQSNMVYNKIIDMSEDLSQEFLNSVSRFLNEQFSECTLSDIRDQMLDSLMEEKEQYDQLLAHVVRLSKKAFDFAEERELYVEGQFNILSEMDDVLSIQNLLQTLEEKISVLDLLDRTLTDGGLNIYIGGENELEHLQEFSFVTANYGNGSNMLGSIGVIGPRRMDYQRVVPIIDYTARVLSQSIAMRSAG